MSLSLFPNTPTVRPTSSRSLQPPSERVQTKAYESGGMSATVVWEWVGESRSCNRAQSSKCEGMGLVTKSLQLNLPSGAVFSGSCSLESPLDGTVASFVPPSWAAKQIWSTDLSNPRIDVDNGLVTLTRGEGASKAIQEVYPDGSTVLRSQGRVVKSDSRGEVSVFREKISTSTPFFGWKPDRALSPPLLGESTRQEFRCSNGNLSYIKPVNFTPLPHDGGVNVDDTALEWLLAPSILTQRRASGD